MVAISGVAATGDVFAQSARGADERSLSVRERIKPEYDAIGLGFGGFRFFPQASYFLEATDNIFAAPAPADEDEIIARARVAGALNSQWSTHALGLNASVQSNTYSNFDTNNETEWSAGLFGRYDFSSTFQLSANAAVEEKQEAATTTPSSVPIAELISFEAQSLDVSAVKQFDRFRLSLTLRQSVEDYSDGLLQGGGVLDADDRDRTLTEATARVDYQLGPGLAIFAQSVQNTRDYDLEPPQTAVNRNSQGYALVAGASFDITRLIKGEIGAGYLTQSYDEPGAEDTTGTAVQAAIDWFLDELVTVRLAASRAISDADAVNAVSRLTETVDLGADYEFRRNVILGVGSSYLRSDYQGIDREDVRWSAYATMEYQMNRLAGLSARLEHIDQQSSGASLGRDYEVNRATLGIRLRR